MTLNKIKFIWPFFILTIFTLLLTYCLPTPHRYASGILNPFQRLDSTNDEGGEDDDSGENNETIEDDEEEEEIIPENEIDESKIPYDLRMDTMAYMTCNSASPSTDFFHFKIGAFQKSSFHGGIRLKPSFSEAYGSSTSDIKKYPFHIASPFVSFVENETEPKSGTTFRINNERIKTLHKLLPTLVEKETDGYENSFNNQPISAKWFINDTPGHFNHMKVLQRIKNNDLLVGFENKGTTRTHISSNDNYQYIHGRYYTIETEIKLGDSDFGSYVITGVEERYPAASKQSSNTTWECRNYKVMRHADDAGEGEASCDVASSADSSEYKLVQTVLKNEEGDRDKWIINTDKKCISPKDPLINSDRPTCYYLTDRSGGVISVDKVTDEANCSYTDFNNICRHYLSICTLELIPSNEDD